MKLYIYIMDHEAALKGDFSWSLIVSTRDNLDCGDTKWPLVGEVDVELNLDNNTITQCAINDLDREIQELRATSEAQITRLEQRKQELLAITFQPDDAS